MLGFLAARFGKIADILEEVDRPVILLEQNPTRSDVMLEWHGSWRLQPNLPRRPLVPEGNGRGPALHVPVRRSRSLQREQRLREHVSGKCPLGMAATPAAAVSSWLRGPTASPNASLWADESHQGQGQ